VGLSDYTAVVRNFGVGTSWDQGAVTYGATVGLDDYTAVVRNFGVATPAVVGASSTAGSSVANPQPAAAPAPSTTVVAAGAKQSHKPAKTDRKHR